MISYDALADYGMLMPTDILKYHESIAAITSYENRPPSKAHYTCAERQPSIAIRANSARRSRALDRASSAIASEVRVSIVAKC